MKRTRLLLSLMAFWEVVRFSLFFFLLDSGLSVDGATSPPFVLWFGAPQLMVGVAFAAATVFPGRYAAILPLGLLAKVVSLALGFLSILTGTLPIPSVDSSILPLVISLGPVAIVGIDALAVVILVGLLHTIPRGEGS
ncbi:MAG: hypothetical protein ACLFPV_09540 [Spirochaetaceae bacterium]